MYLLGNWINTAVEPVEGLIDVDLGVSAGRIQVFDRMPEFGLVDSFVALSN